ncbi:hypothetical protein B7494_g6042 [Chlorociboria aeruginascens]|nr:hypothetical protein B7494_g6042 [Chlorociboria aeruginascens]
MAPAGGLEVDDDSNIADLITDLENASRIPSKQRSLQISGLVDRVCLKSYEDGLPGASLDQLIDIVTLPNALDQGSRGRLIKHLYPVSSVSDKAVIKVVGALGHGQAKPPYAAQSALLKWMVMVYDVLQDPKLLSRLYGVLFDLLDTIAIRPQLCHVLSLITQRKHVRRFRIQALMELTRQAGNDPPLLSLMRVYKDYYPDVILGGVISGRASVFTHPDREWAQRLAEIQKIYIQKSQDGLPPAQRTFKTGRRGVKRGASSVIPEVYTSRAQASSTTLEEIEDVDSFIRKLEKIQLPNQLVAVIGDPLLQKFLQLKSSDVTLQRVDNWLLAFFEDQLQSTDSENKTMYMLQSIREYTHFTKELPHACLSYLNAILHTWDGTIGRDVIIDLLAYTPMDFFEATFQPLEAAILDATVDSQLALVTFYTTLLHRWASRLLSESQPPPEAGQAISSLISHVNTLALSVVQRSSTVVAHSKVLSFYEAVISLTSQHALYPIVQITIPTAKLVYTLQFSLSLCIVSRLCAILALYKRAFEFAMSPKQLDYSSVELAYPKDYVNHFNGFLMDICNCFWRSRGFNTTDLNANGCLLPTHIVPQLSKYVASLDTSLSLSSLFSFSYSPIFCLLAINFVRDLEDDTEDEIKKRHAGPVTQISLRRLDQDGGLKLLWADYRLGVLHYLEYREVMGVGELMYNTMKHLMSARVQFEKGD